MWGRHQWRDALRKYASGIFLAKAGSEQRPGKALFFFTLKGTSLQFFKKKDKKDEIRDEIKAKENILILKSINAAWQLTEANAIAIRDGKTNGEMHEAILR